MLGRRGSIGGGGGIDGEKKGRKGTWASASGHHLGFRGDFLRGFLVRFRRHGWIDFFFFFPRETELQTGEAEGKTYRANPWAQPKLMLSMGSWFGYPETSYGFGLIKKSHFS